jgi:hypothetical protein
MVQVQYIRGMHAETVTPFFDAVGVFAVVDAKCMLRSVANVLRDKTSFRTAARQDDYGGSVLAGLRGHVDFERGGAAYRAAVAARLAEETIAEATQVTDALSPRRRGVDVEEVALQRSRLGQIKQDAAAAMPPGAPRHSFQP